MALRPQGSDQVLFLPGHHLRRPLGVQLCGDCGSGRRMVTSQQADAVGPVGAQRIEKSQKSGRTVSPRLTSLTSR